jgi:chromosome partitioning protein
MPSIVGFVGFKGGSGKTLLAFQMAERAQNAGLRVMLWDLDPEQSAMHHTTWRSETDRPQWEAEPRRIDAPPETGLDMRGLSDIDLVICDFPGYNTFLSAAYMDRMDLLLAPISTTAQDRTVMTRMGWLAQSRGWQLVFVPNNLRPSRARQNGLVEDLESGSFSVAPVRISRWVSLQDSSEMGLSVCEYEPESQAAAEIRALWDWVASQINLESRLT